MDTTQRAMDGLIADWAALTAGCGIEPARIDGWLAGATGGPAAFTNQGLLAERCEEPARALTEIVAWYEQRDLPFMMQVPEDLDAASERALDAAGFSIRETLPMMTAKIDGAPRRPEDIEIRRVVTEDDRMRYVAVAAAGFEAPPENPGAFAAPGVLAHPAFAMFVALLDGRPAGCGQVAVQDGAAGLYSIATAPDARRRGVGRAVTNALLAHAANNGATLAYLQASTMGTPLYEQLGFRTVARHHLYARG